MLGARQLAFSTSLRTPPRGPSTGVTVRRRGAPGVRCSHTGGDEGSANRNQGRFKLFYNDVYEVSKPYALSPKP